MLALLPVAAGHERPKQLSEDPLITLHPAALSAGDVKALKALVKEQEFVRGPSEGAHWKETMKAGIHGGEYYCKLNVSSLDDEEERENEAGWATVRRLLELAKVADGEVVVTRWETWPSHVNRSGPLHMDPRLHAFRQRTVLAYLTGTGEQAEGATVFPCVETPDMEPKEAARRERLCSRAAKILRSAQEVLLKEHAHGADLPPDQQLKFLEDKPELAFALPLETDGVRPGNWLWTSSHDETLAQEPPQLRLEPFLGLVEDMCRGKKRGLRVLPKEGDVISFEVAEWKRQGLLPDWRLWHAGCSPVTGHGRRWTAQVFVQEHSRPSRAKKTGADGRGKEGRVGSKSAGHEQCTANPETCERQSGHRV